MTRSCPTCGREHTPESLAYAEGREREEYWQRDGRIEGWAAGLAVTLAALVGGVAVILGVGR